MVTQKPKTVAKPKPAVKKASAALQNAAAKLANSQPVTRESQQKKRAGQRRAAHEAAQVERAAEKALLRQSVVPYERPNFEPEVTERDTKEAFQTRPMTGADMEAFRIRHQLSEWDFLFLMGFTNYRSLKDYKQVHRVLPLDMPREILLRLYMLEPSFPRFLKAPTILDMLDMLFNIGEGTSDSERQACAPMLSITLGRARISGYRWFKTASEGEGSPVQLPIQRLISKLFSMDPRTARKRFWRAALATIESRSKLVALVDPNKPTKKVKGKTKPNYLRGPDKKIVYQATNQPLYDTTLLRERLYDRNVTL